MRVEAPDWEINDEIFDISPAPGDAAMGMSERKPRNWLMGEVALEPYDIPAQGQKFANWARSRLTTYVGVEPPEGYAGFTYNELKARPDIET